MQLLDAIIAFALTMAALATVVTVIMEAGLRIARMRKKNFIEVMKLLNKELDKGLFGKNGAIGMSEDERWDFIVRVVNNPAEAAFDKIKPELDKLTLEGRLDYFGKDKAAGAGKLERAWNFITNLFGDKKRACLYDGVSLEYLLRCLVDTPGVKKASRTASDTLKVEFNRLAKKYEEFGSSVSASFKRHSQYWSILIGILLAVFANIDGVRIFNAYREDPALASALIENQEKLLKKNEAVQASIDKFKKAEKEFETAEKEWKEAKVAYEKDNSAVNKTAFDQKEAAKNEKEEALQEEANIKDIHETFKNARQQIADLAKLGVPIGWDFYPYCPYDEDDSAWEKSSPKCRDIQKKETILESKCPFFRIINTLLVDWPRFIIWFIVVVISGILIGLGAPFWFDVAKRLSAIRKGLQSAAASSEYRLSGKNADGNADTRNEIVKNTIEQAKNEAAIEPVDIPKGRTVLAPNGTPYMKG